MICVPETKDVSSGKKLMEPQHEDPYKQLRQQKRVEHKKLLKQSRRKRVKLRKTCVNVS